MSVKSVGLNRFPTLIAIGSHFGKPVDLHWALASLMLNEESGRGSVGARGSIGSGVGGERGTGLTSEQGAWADLVG